MPFDGSGNFTRDYNWVDDKNNGIKIVASRMDGEFDNYAGALNQTFLRNGVVPMTGNLNMGTNVMTALGDGTVGSPAMRFNSDPTTGLYSPGYSKVALTAGGTNRVEANSTGVILTGTVTHTGQLNVIGLLNFPTAPGNIQVAGVTALSMDGASNVAIVGAGSVGTNLTVAQGATVGGSMGIGTVSPAGTFHALGTSANSQLISGFAGGSTFYSDHNTHYFRSGLLPFTTNFLTMSSGGARFDVKTGVNVDPLYPLHVQATGLNTYPFVVSNHSGATLFDINEDASGHGVLELSTGSSATVAIRSSGLSYINGGYVGIGISAPTGRLHVQDTASDSQIIAGYAGGSTYYSDHANHYFRTGTAGFNATMLALTAAGAQFSQNVGIGVAPGGYRFAVKATSAGSFVQVYQSASGNDLWDVLSDASENAEIYGYAAGNSNTIKFDTAGTSFFNGGNVGVMVGGTSIDTTLKVGPGTGQHVVSVDGGTGFAEGGAFTGRKAGSTYFALGPESLILGASASTDTVVMSYATALKLQTGAAVGIEFKPNNAVAMTIDAVGVIRDKDSRELGYKDIPQNAQAGAYTLLITDRGCHIYCTGGAAAVTIPPNSTAAFPIGSAVTVINDGSGVRTLTQGAGVTLKWAGTGTAGNRSLAVGGVATLIKVGTDTWYVSGAGVS